MLMLVLGENLLVTFLGWEGVGTCSLLPDRVLARRATSAATAGKKAFVTNRVGDWGFMIAMFLAFQAIGTLELLGDQRRGRVGTMAQTTATAIALLLFVGAVGKSAQLPLYLWLPDAMEGPTPVSALIHAATMVTAGVFLMVRMSPFLRRRRVVAPTLIAIDRRASPRCSRRRSPSPRTTSRRVLAYSTVSQLGYMFLAVGSGAYVAAIFHMITHAFFKALLFLGSGSVIHGMHDEQDMRRMGAPAQVHAGHRGHVHRRLAGDRRRAAVRRLLGKDEILLCTRATRARCCGSIGLVTALLTAYYMTRQVIMVFYGKARWEDRARGARRARRRSSPTRARRSCWCRSSCWPCLSIVGGVDPRCRSPTHDREADAVARARRRVRRAQHHRP